LGYNSATFMSAEHFLENGMIAETTCLITDLQMPARPRFPLRVVRSQTEDANEANDVRSAARAPRGTKSPRLRKAR